MSIAVLIFAAVLAGGSVAEWLRPTTGEEFDVWRDRP